jgi:hypothetical protein
MAKKFFEVLCFRAPEDTVIPSDATHFVLPPHYGWFGNDPNGGSCIWAQDDRFCEWCQKNIRGPHGAYTKLGKLMVWFANPSDAVMFKVAWL